MWPREKIRDYQHDIVIAVIFAPEFELLIDAVAENVLEIVKGLV
jgi:hypothetical protein